MWFSNFCICFGMLSVVYGVNSTGLNPIQNMCVRIDHQSTIKDGILYIDGGTETFVDDNNSGEAMGLITLGYNTYLIAVNMSTSWDWKLNISESLIIKAPNPKTGTSPPQVVRGALYQGMSTDNNIYLYGGTTSFLNTSFPGFVGPSVEQYTLWSYDTVGGTWDQFDITSASPERPNSGAYAEAPDQGLAFYLNGQIDNGSAPDTAWLGYDNRQSLEGMVVIDTQNQTARNLSTLELTGYNPRTRGRIQYLPGIGEHGVLVSIGGSYKNVADVDNEDIGTLVSMNAIDIFDINQGVYGGSNGWYTQNTTGDIPEPRVDHCLTAASAPDNSSHNIYIYGGRGSATLVYDQIYVLSLPSFQWTKIYEGQSPRYGMTCHLVGNRQMLTVGGFTGPDLTTGCDWEDKGVAIYDMSTLKWGSVFDAFDSHYTVPGQVVATIGGTVNGSANATRPVGDWSSATLAQVFNSTLLPSSASNGTLPSASPTPSAMPSSSGGGLSKGAIAGIVVGSTAAIVLVASGVWSRRRWLAKSDPEYKDDYLGSNGTDVKNELEVPHAELETPHNVVKGRRLMELGPEMPTVEMPS